MGSRIGQASHRGGGSDDELERGKPRNVLSKHIEEAREELSRGEVHRGTVDDLMKEMSNENAHLG